MSTMLLQNLKLAIIGLGYVGLPLAVEFGKTHSVIGFDINQKRIDELKPEKTERLRQRNKSYEMLSVSALQPILRI